MKYKKVILPFLVLLTTVINIYSVDCSQISEWSSGTAYNGGDQVQYDGIMYTAQWWTQNEIPPQNVGAGLPWVVDGTCDAAVPNYQSPVMTPSNGSAMNSNSETFSWTAVDNASGYEIWVETAAGVGDIYHAGGDGTTALSYTVSNLPVDGSTILVRLKVFHSTGPQIENYTYTAYTNTAPTDITVFTQPVEENSPVGTHIVQLTAVDSDVNDTHIFSMNPAEGDNALFTLTGDKLYTAEVFDYEVKNLFNLAVTVTDNFGASFTKNFSLGIVDVDPEYQYPKLTGAGEDMKVEGVVLFSDPDNTEKGDAQIHGSEILISKPLDASTDIDSKLSPDSLRMKIETPSGSYRSSVVPGVMEVTSPTKGLTRVQGGEITARKLIVDELEYSSNPGNVDGSFTVPGALNVGGSVAVGGAVAVEGEAEFNKITMSKTEEGNATFTQTILPDSIKMTLDAPGSLYRTYLKSGRLSLMTNQSGETVIDGGSLTTSSLNVSGVFNGGNILSLAKNDIVEGNNTPTFGLDTSFLYMGMIEGNETIGWGLHLNAFSWDGYYGQNAIHYHGGEHIFSTREDQGTGADIELMKITNSGTMIVKNGLSLGEYLRIGEDNDHKVELKKGNLTFANKYSFPGGEIDDIISIQNDRRYTGAGIDEGLQEISVRRVDIDGTVHYETRIESDQISTDKIETERVVTEKIDPEASITVGHGNWLNLNTLAGNRWMLHSPASQNKFLIGYDPTLGGVGDDNIWGYFSILDNGNVGIGTTAPESKLHVEGTITADKVKIGDWTIEETPDYVFKDDYKLLSLEDVEKHIKEKSHLPEVPSAADMKRDGVDLAQMNMILLRKVEELTLYIIDQEKDSKKQGELIERLARKIAAIEKN